jgi:hypothetical protein
VKKLALAIGFAAYVVFGASSGTLAANKVDNGAGVATNRDSRIWSDTATNPRLLFLNEALYPETTVTGGAASPAAHGIQERVELALSNTASTDSQRMACDGDICLVA